MKKILIFIFLCVISVGMVINFSSSIIKAEEDNKSDYVFEECIGEYDENTKTISFEKYSYTLSFIYNFYYVVERDVIVYDGVYDKEYLSLRIISHNHLNEIDYFINGADVIELNLVDGNKLVSIYAPINNYESFVEQCIPASLNDEYNYDKLVNLLNIRYDFIYYVGNDTNTVNSITSSDVLKKRDAFTNSMDIVNYFIDNYDKMLVDTNSGDIFNDSLITSVIPKEFFTEAGNNSYIGNRYGYYIDTYLSNNKYYSKVIVFEVYQVLRVNFVEPEIKITPCFSGNAVYYPNYDIVTFTLGSKLALYNMQTGLVLRNKGQLNIGDTGYVKANDYGAFFGSLDTDVYGVYRNRDHSSVAVVISFLTNGASTLLSPFVSLNLPQQIIVNILTDLVNRFADTNYTKKSITGFTNHEYFESNRIAYFTANKNFNRNLNFKLDNQEITDNKKSNPLLYKLSNHYFKMNYSMIFPQDGLESDLFSQVHVSICEDNTKFFIFGSGTLDHLDTLSQSYQNLVTDSYMENNREIETDEEVYAYFTGAQIYKTYEFTPSSSGTYSIIFNNSTPFILFFSDSTVDLESFKNAEVVNNNFASLSSSYYAEASDITFSLISGVTYYLCVRADVFEYTSRTFKIEKINTVYEIFDNFSNVNHTLSIQNGSNYLKFSPEKTGMYVININSMNSNVNKIELYNSNLSLLSSENVSGLSTYELIYYMEEGCNYYINLNSSSNTTVKTTISNCEAFDTSRSDILNSSEYITYIIQPDFVANGIDFYKFRHSSSNILMTIYLYDESFNLLNELYVSSQASTQNISTYNGNLKYIVVRNISSSINSDYSIGIN